jgi:hypothetical protein
VDKRENRGTIISNVGSRSPLIHLELGKEKKGEIEKEAHKGKKEEGRKEGRVLIVAPAAHQQ